jgi:hypothetical protein
VRPDHLALPRHGLRRAADGPTLHAGAFLISKFDEAAPCEPAPGRRSVPEHVCGKGCEACAALRRQRDTAEAQVVELREVIRYAYEQPNHSPEVSRRLLAALGGAVGPDWDARRLGQPARCWDCGALAPYVEGSWTCGCGRAWSPWHAFRAGRR